MRSSGVVLNQLSSQRKNPCTGGTDSWTPAPLETGVVAACAARRKTEASKQRSLGLMALFLCNHAIRSAQESVNCAASILKPPLDKRKSIVAMKAIGFSYDSPDPSRGLALRTSLLGLS